MLSRTLTSKKDSVEETPTTEHPYQVNLANYEAKAIRELFGISSETPNSRVGQELYLFAISCKLQANHDERSATEYINSFRPL